jgi:PAS domain S-box-containing protein
MKKKSDKTKKNNTEAQDNVNRHEQIEELLKQSENKYRTLLETIQDGYFEIDLAGNFTFFKYRVPDPWLPQRRSDGHELSAVFRQRGFEKSFQVYNKVYVTGGPNREFGWQITRKDGTKKYIEGYISLEKDSSDKPIGFRGIIRDITDSKKIEEKLRKEEQRFRALEEHSSDIIVLVNRKGIITYENQAIERVLGFNVEERIGASLFDLIHPDVLKFLTDEASVLVRNKNAPVLRSEVRLCHKDGSWRTFDVTGCNLVNDQVIEGGIVNLHDITERKKAEVKLQQNYESLMEPAFWPYRMWWRLWHRTVPIARHWVLKQHLKRSKKTKEFFMTMLSWTPA